MMLPRAKCAATTRETMLASAKRRFLQESYENVGLRDIAGDAGVDVALVGRYFGSKEELFREVLRGTPGDWLESDVEAEALPRWLARLATRPKDEGTNEDIERLLIILRSASSPHAAAVVRDCFRAAFLEPMATRIGGPEAEMRASVALSLLMGTTVLRSIMSVEPLCNCDADGARERLERLFEAALGAPTAT